MIRIVDRNQGNNSDFGTGTYTLLDRDVYRRISLVGHSQILLGSKPEDSANPLKYFLDEMEKIDGGDSSNSKAVEIDVFLGSLGVSQEYPHKDREVFN